MSNREDQLLELEALESLFPEEMRRDPSGDDKSFSLVNILPFSDYSETNYVSVSIDFVFPLGYPSDEPIGFSVSKLTGPIATDSSKRGELSALIHEEIASNFGMCAVYQVVEKVVEWLRSNNEKEKSLFDQMSKPTRADEIIQRSSDDDSEYVDESDECDSDDDDSDDYSESDEEYHGLSLKNLCAESARVTDSEFGQWRMEYEKWLMANGVIKRSLDSRPTGKEQFLNNLAANRGQKTAADKPVADDPTMFDPSLFEDDDALLLDDEEEVDELVDED